jgi:AcrR family transcriptional regulator
MTAANANNAARIDRCCSKIADHDGLDRLTLRRVADALGTGPASIYRHIANRDELLTLLCEDLAGGFPLIPDAPSPREAVRRQWRAVHHHLIEHPWGAPVIAAGGRTAASGERLAKHAIAQLSRLGLTKSDAERAYRVLWQLVLGHLLNAHPLGHGRAADRLGDDDGDLDWAIERLLRGSLA